MEPKISIIIPTYNRAEYLKQTIESALAQDYKNYEVIVSDNASTDNTTEAIQEFLSDEKFSYYKNETNIGMVKNWHKALYEYVSGEWFVILSDDDYFIDVTYLSKAVALMAKDDEIGIVYANGYIKHEDTGKMVPLELPFDEINEGKDIFLSRGSVKPQDFTLCNILFKKEEALKYKPFENEFNIGCDSELFLLMCLSCKVGIVHQKVSVYRIHGSNLIKTMGSDFNILLNTLEHILNPYKSLKKTDLLPEIEIRNFEEDVLFPTLKSYYMNCKVYFPKEISIFENKIGLGLQKKINLSLIEKLKIVVRYFLNRV